MEVINKHNKYYVEVNSERTRIEYIPKLGHNLFLCSWLSDNKRYYYFTLFSCRGFGGIENKRQYYKAAILLFKYLRNNNLFVETWNISFKKSVA